jgi:hypothetical protein
MFGWAISSCKGSLNAGLYNLNISNVQQLVYSWRHLHYSEVDHWMMYSFRGTPGQGQRQIRLALPEHATATASGKFQSYPVSHLRFEGLDY